MYRTVFGILDLDGGGTIEEEELKVGLQAIDRCPSDEELQSMLLEVDESGDGEVDFAEFLQFMMVVKRRQSSTLVLEGAIAEGDEGEQEEEEEKGGKKQKKHKAGADEIAAKSSAWHSKKLGNGEAIESSSFGEEKGEKVKKKK
jgi:hypothetical protein